MKSAPTLTAIGAGIEIHSTGNSEVERAAAIAVDRLVGNAEAANHRHLSNATGYEADQLHVVPSVEGEVLHLFGIDGAGTEFGIHLGLAEVYFSLLPLAGFCVIGFIEMQRYLRLGTSFISNNFGHILPVTNNRFAAES